ncbi:hypothetical protein [Aldersonia kunmingensis]|uniref:hypothetical protein n=1 Tax=Aldersonia kunmingensis TaxID=408066 RepID=UPI0009FE8BFA|nr:hypothetical protein [Aldersonia kunmingensis]
MTTPNNDIAQLARRVDDARGRMVYQSDPALTEVLSENELQAERDLAERIRVEDRAQRWKHVQATAAAADRARGTAEEIERADMRDLLIARKAIAAQRRESSPHAKLASLYQNRTWSLRALAGVVVAGMLWSAVNVQHNIAPGGASDPLFWFSYLLEAMISVCLIIIMIGTNKVAEWGVLDSRWQVATAEAALLSLTIGLNVYPYVRTGDWYDAMVHAVAPVMIGVALLIHNAASQRYGLAIYRATDAMRDMPDPAEQIRQKLRVRRMSTMSDYNDTTAPQQPTDSAPPIRAIVAVEPATVAVDAEVLDDDAAVVATPTTLSGAKEKAAAEVDALFEAILTRPSDDKKNEGSADASAAAQEGPDLVQELAELQAARKRARGGKRS